MGEIHVASSFLKKKKKKVYLFLAALGLSFGTQTSF